MTDTETGSCDAGAYRSSHGVEHVPLCFRTPHYVEPIPSSGELKGAENLVFPAFDGILPAIRSGT